MTIISIKTANGTPLRFQYDDGDQNNNLHITLDRRYAAGETLRLRIDYQTAFVVGEYEDDVQRWNGIELHSHGYTDEMEALRATTLRRAVQADTGQPMDCFFDQWLYKMGHPIFEVTKTYDAAQQQLRLQLRQTQQPDRHNAYPQVEFFQGKMDIEIDGRSARAGIV